MLVGTKHGDTYSESEIGGWMKAAGLDGIKTLEAPSGAQYIIGVKP
jgi:hypothetical protein